MWAVKYWQYPAYLIMNESEGSIKHSLKPVPKKSHLLVTMYALCLCQPWNTHTYAYSSSRSEKNPPCTLRTLVQRRTIRWSSSNCVHGSCGYGSNTPAYWIKTESEVPPNTVWTLSRLSRMFHQVLSEPCEDSHKINRALIEPFRVTSLIKQWPNPIKTESRVTNPDKHCLYPVTTWVTSPPSSL